MKVTVLESKQEEDYEPNLKKLAKDSDLTFAIGFLMKDSLTKISKDMGEKNFAIIDAVVDSSNVKSIVFKEDEGSFLMGIIAGKMTKTNKVGFIGGVDGSTVQKFESGYNAGVKAVNPAAAEGLISRKTVKYVGSFSDPKKGYELAKVLYNDGCDVIYHASGSSGLGLLKAAKESKKWAIGVDQDQAVTAPDYKEAILSSMVKKVDAAAYEASKEVIEGKFRGGKANILVIGLKGDGVGMAPTTKNNTPQDVIDLADKYKNAIVDGKFKVPSKLEEVREFTVPAM
ncbi:BMP family ABC transporter substrate-binding protein [Clostridium polyendosporum]|uniref:BMP family ABC transporter substrate-binding protein n=1 Tax=Clostridium polyendosporum TaxID=69208 RepID=A0A919S128_9CLOT|nr:BMP family ABC transporter substrate-binding protein [Clostridium polyendosporum]